MKYGHLRNKTSLSDSYIFLYLCTAAETDLSTRESQKPKDNTTLITTLIVLFVVAIVFVFVLAMKIYRILKHGRLKKYEQGNVNEDKNVENGTGLSSAQINGQKTVTFTRTRMISTSSVINSTSPLLYGDYLWRNGPVQADLDGKFSLFLSVTILVP